MNVKLRADSELIIRKAIHAVQPDSAVKKALSGQKLSGKIVLISVGKAAWQMAHSARECLGSRITQGLIITKYGHDKGPISNFECVEAGHPIPDENSFTGTEKAIKLVSGLSEDDTVLFLLSGGGSALFELPKVCAEELQDVTKQLLACGADIVEINTIRKRLSNVKGGRFAQLCKPARVYSVVLSDILGDPLDMIASGPACPDSSSCEDAKRIAEKYALRLSEAAKACLSEETPKEADHVKTVITGSVKELCNAAAKACEELGYETFVLSDRISCQAKEAGSFLAAIVKTHYRAGSKKAFIAGGETVVHLTGSGKGGRNQELALSAAIGLEGLKNAAVFSVGSDGTDGPTDAAGGYVDGDTCLQLKCNGIDIHQILAQNDAYSALARANGLIITGPTGTNVNDVAVALIDCASDT